MTETPNPKDQVGSKKFSISVVPHNVLAELAVAMQEGAAKYGAYNYRKSKIRASIYQDATFRHMAAWWEGEDIDPDSGLSHLTKAIASLTVLRDAIMQNTWIDDRPPGEPPSKWVTELNNKSKDLVGKFPDQVPRFTRI